MYMAKISNFNENQLGLYNNITNYSYLLAFYLSCLSISPGNVLIRWNMNACSIRAAQLVEFLIAITIMDATIT